MQGVAVTLLTEDGERLSVLQHWLEGTGMGRNVFSHVGFPSSPTDPVLRQMQDVRSEVVILDIDAHSAQRAISAIEIIHANTSDIAIFAVGEMNHPPTIVAAMRAGAGEFLERSAKAAPPRAARGSSP
jgi:DNA-binding NarL/FixJ family response regulator